MAYGQTPSIMIRAFLKPAFRSLWKSKVHSFLNIFGLAIGIACAGLIFLWVEDELNYDQTFEKREQLYRVLFNHYYDNGKTYTFFDASPGLFGPAIKEEIPGIANTCRLSGFPSPMLFNSGDKPIYENGFYAEPSFLSLFGIRFLQGKASDAFRELNSVVISEKMARRLFGDEKNIAGRLLKMDNASSFVITGVVADMPRNWYVMNRWLQDFAYRIDLQWWIFVAAGLLAIAIALLTVSFQSIKTALMNPVQSLRAE
jgi:putative ABC transport system permease protein